MNEANKRRSQYQELNDDAVLLHLVRAQATGGPQLAELREVQRYREEIGTWAPHCTLEDWDWAHQFAQDQACRLGRSRASGLHDVEEWARVMGPGQAEAQQ